MKTLKRLFIGLITLTFLGCSLTPLKTPKHKKISGFFHITSDLGTLEPVDSLRFSVKGSVHNYKTSFNLEYGNLTVGKTKIPSTDNYYHLDRFESDFSGRMVTVTLSNKENTVNVFSVDLYFPQIITSADVHVPNPLISGSTLTWNSDSNNHQGVTLYLTYNEDRLHVNTGDSKEITIPNDDGAYTFTNEDLKDMNSFDSDSNYCLISIVRGSSKLVALNSNPKIKSKVAYSFSSPQFVTRSGKTSSEFMK